MRTKSLVLIIIALGCGLIASIGISEVLKQKSGGGSGETEPILVAAIDIDINKKLDAQNVKIEEWPKGKVPEGALHTLDDVADQFTRARLYSGEPILSAKLMDDQNPNAGTTIPDGYRVIPVRVELDTVIGLIQPGDLVDVMVFLRQGPDVPRTGTYTILRMVRVFAVNTQTDRSVDEKGQEIAAKTLSLLVKPKQGERLTLASELGKLRLALRRPTDEIPDDEEIAKDLPAIFRDAEIVAIDAPKRAEPVVAPSPVVTQQNVALAASPVWTMRVMSPSETKQFDWSDAKDLPQPASPGSQPTYAEEPAPVDEPSPEPASEEPSKSAGE